MVHAPLAGLGAEGRKADSSRDLHTQGAPCTLIWGRSVRTKHRTNVTGEPQPVRPGVSQDVGSAGGGGGAPGWASRPAWCRPS